MHLSRARYVLRRYFASDAWSDLHKTIRWAAWYMVAIISVLILFGIIANAPTKHQPNPRQDKVVFTK